MIMYLVGVIGRRLIRVKCFGLIIDNFNDNRKQKRREKQRKSKRQRKRVGEIG